MRRLLERAVGALYRYYRTDEDGKTAYRSALIVFSIGPLFNVGMLCEVVGLTNFLNWRLSSEYRIEFYVVAMIVGALMSFVLSRIAPYEVVVSEAERMQYPRLVLSLTLSYIIGSVFAPVLVLMAMKHLGW